MTRPELEWASLALVERTFKVCQQALDVAGCEPGELDRVILVGGATRMPMVARKVEQFFGRPPIVRINPDEVVALGAAIQAALLDKTKQRTGPAEHPRIAEESVVQPLPPDEQARRGSEPPAGLPIVSKSDRPPPTPVPIAQIVLARPPVLAARPAKPLVFDFPPSVPEPRAPVPPPVAPRSAPLLIDVTPLSLGVETVAGFCDRLIDANTPVPCDRTRAFTTASDGQTTVVVRVAQGESKRFEENTFLGELELSGIAAAPRGETQIAVTFVIDPDGILDVRARDQKTGREQTARLQLVGAQATPADVEAMRARQAAHPLANP
jgi:molecular chaperone DnaK